MDMNGGEVVERMKKNSQGSLIDLCLQPRVKRPISPYRFPPEWIEVLPLCLGFSFTEDNTSDQEDPQELAPGSARHLKAIKSQI